MCLSQLYQVIAVADRARVHAKDAYGRESFVSLLAYDGPPPAVGTWLLVHSGYALAPLPEEEAATVRAAVEVARGGREDDR